MGQLLAGAFPDMGRNDGKRTAFLGASALEVGRNGRAPGGTDLGSSQDILFTPSMKGNFFSGGRKAPGSLAPANAEAEAPTETVTLALTDALLNGWCPQNRLLTAFRSD